MKKPVTSKNYLLTLQMFTWAQMFTLIAFSGIILFLTNTGQLSGDEKLVAIFQYVVPLAVITSLATAHFVFKAMTGKPNDANDLKEKLKKFKGAYVTRTAILEVSGLLGAVAALITGELLFLSAAVLIAVILFIGKPTKFTISEDLKLTTSERDLLSNPQSVVAEI